MSHPIGLVGGLSGAERARVAQLEQPKPEKASDVHEAALQFEQIMVRQMLEPLEKSLTRSMGGESGSPMIGGMILNSLSQSITDGGGLGLASVIEEALRDATSPQVSPGVTPESQLGDKSDAAGET